MAKKKIEGLDTLDDLLGEDTPIENPEIVPSTEPEIVPSTEPEIVPSTEPEKPINLTRVKVLVKRLIRVFELPVGYPERENAILRHQEALKIESIENIETIEQAQELLAKLEV